MEHVSNECTSQVHMEDISEHMRNDEIDHVGHTNINNELLNEFVTGIKVENLRSALHEAHYENE